MDGALINFLSDVFSAFFGAFLAFLFGFRLYKIQKRSDNLAYLQYAISALAGEMGGLYSLKEQNMVARMAEYSSCMAEIERAKHEGGAAKIHIEHNSKIIYGGSVSVPINIERFEFLVSKDPNLISFIGTAIGYLETLNEMLDHANDDVQSYISKTRVPDTQDVLMLLEKNRLLYEQVDCSIYLIEKLISLLAEYGKLEYGDQMNIKSITIVNEKYKPLKPPPIESWEVVEWFNQPKRRKWYQKFKK